MMCRIILSIFILMFILLTYPEIRSYGDSELSADSDINNHSTTIIPILNCIVYNETERKSDTKPYDFINYGLLIGHIFTVEIRNKSPVVHSLYIRLKTEYKILIRIYKQCIYIKIDNGVVW